MGVTFARKRASRLAQGILLLAVMALSGCIPAPLGKYYQPSMDIRAPKHYSGTDCHGQAGAPAVLHVSLGDGVNLRIDAMRPRETPSGKGRPLHLVLDVPPGTTVQWDNATARVSPDGGHEWRDLPLRASVRAQRQMPWRVAMADLAPTSVSAIKSGSFRATATLDYSFAHFVPRRFAMVVPAIRIVGGSTVGEASFEARAQQRPESYPGEYRTHHSLIYTTPESRARLKTRLGDCQAEVREGVKGLHCDGIPVYDEGRFERSEGPFTVSGRWYVFDVEDGTPFNGELQFEYEVPIDWSFSRQALQLQDPDGPARTVASRDWTLYMSYDIAPETAVRGVNDTRFASATTLSLEADLGAGEVAAYLVKLPDLRINGKRQQLPLIELGKHLLDLGLEPFNC